MLRAPAAHVFHAVGDASSREPPKAFERERGAQTIAAQTFASKVVACFDPHARVQVETVALHRERRPCRANSLRLARAAVGFVLARRKHRQCPAVHGDRRAAIEGRGLRRLVRALFERSFIEQAATPEPHESAITYAAHDCLEVDERGWRRGMKHNAVVGIANEDTIEHDDVHVHVQVQAPPEALHESHSTALAAHEKPRNIEQTASLVCFGWYSKKT